MATTVNALYFAGDAFIRFKDPTTGLFSAPESLELDKLEIKTENERKEKLSKRRATRGQPFVSFAVPKPSTFAITFSEVSRRVFAMLLAAKLETLTVNTAAITAHEVTVAPGVWAVTGLKYIDPTGFTVKNEAGDTTYVKDVDYLIDYELGHIKPIVGGAISAGTVKLDGNTEAISGTRLRGGQQYNQVMHIELNGVNLLNSRRMILNAPQAAVASDSAYDFLGDELADVPLNGTLEIVTGGTEPFTLDYLEAE